MVSGPSIVPFAQSYSIEAERGSTWILMCVVPHVPGDKRCILRGLDTAAEVINKTKLTIAKSLFRLCENMMPSKLIRPGVRETTLPALGGKVHCNEQSVVTPNAGYLLTEERQPVAYCI